MGIDPNGPAGLTIKAAAKHGINKGFDKAVNELYGSDSKERSAHYKTSELGYGTKGRLPLTFSRLMKRKGYRDGDFVDYGYTPTHNLRTSGNRDWRNPKTGEQYIFDMYGALVVDELNHGTFDKEPPGKSIRRHLRVDAWPYVKWGNSPKDPSTPSERLQALIDTVFYKRPNEMETQRWIESVTQ